MNKNLELLRQITAFEQLEDAELSAIAPKFIPKNYIKHETIISYREKNHQYVYFMTSGSVRTTRYSMLGREVSYQVLKSGDMFGELSAIDQLPRMTEVIALENTSLLLIRQADFYNLLMSQPKVAWATLLKLNRMIRFLENRAFEFAVMNVNKRIQAELIRLSEDDQFSESKIIPNMATHQELANNLGTRREAVTHELSRLKKMGIIRTDKKNLFIQDIARLEELIDEE